MKKYNISKASELLGVSPQTLRNWDKNNILKPSIVMDNGYRYYTDDDLNNYLSKVNHKYTFEKLEKSKVFRDPLYGNITVEYKLLWDLIDTREVQRLRRIRQLSGVSMVFHTAEHSRFGHALGTYYIAYRMCNEVTDLKNQLSEYEKIVFLAAALLHDVGHGPYSHAFEHVFGLKHEIITCQMIEDENTEINKVLAKYPFLANDIAGIIRHDGKYPLIESLITSQLDVDRLDYLNNLSRYICANKPSLPELIEKYEEVMSRKEYPVWIDYLGAILVASGFCVFFGGDVLDAFSAGLLGVVITVIRRFMSKVEENQMAKAFVSSLVAGFLAIICVNLGIGDHVDKIMIGGIMLLIPGIAMTNSIRDMLIGDIVTGLLRFVNSVLIAGAIACGFALPLFLMGGGGL